MKFACIWCVTGWTWNPTPVVGRAKLKFLKTVRATPNHLCPSCHKPLFILFPDPARRSPL